MKSSLIKLRKIKAESWTIITGVFITSVAKCMVIPFFAVYLVQVMHFSVAAAGIAIASRTLGQRGFIIIGGPLVDWLGAKPVIGLGLILMATSYLFTAYAHNISGIVFWTLILGLGGALYTPAIKTAIVDEASYEDRIFVLSLRSTALNVGSAVGPVIGAMIFVVAPKMIFIFTAATIALLAVISQVLLKIPPKKNKNITFWFSDVISLLKNRSIFKLLIFMIIFYTFFIQLELTYPVFAASNFKDKSIAYLFLLNALIIIGFQMPLSNWITKAHVNMIFIVGMFTLAFGLMITTFSHYSIIIFFIGVAIFSFGEILIVPKLDAETSLRTSKNTVGTAFGVLGLASAVGAAIGGILGGRVYGLFLKANNINYYWAMMGGLIFMTIIILGVIKYYFQKQKFLLLADQ